MKNKQAHQQNHIRGILLQRIQLHNAHRNYRNELFSYLSLLFLITLFMRMPSIFSWYMHSILVCINIFALLFLYSTSIFEQSMCRITHIEGWNFLSAISTYTAHLFWYFKPSTSDSLELQDFCPILTVFWPHRFYITIQALSTSVLLLLRIKHRLFT